MRTDIVSAQVKDGFARFKQTGKLESPNARRIEMKPDQAALYGDSVRDDALVAKQSDNTAFDQDPRPGHVGLRDTLRATFTEQRTEMKVTTEHTPFEQIIETTDAGMVAYQQLNKDGLVSIRAFSLPNQGQAVLFMEEFAAQ
jgi:hypothetical protein